MESNQQHNNSHATHRSTKRPRHNNGSFHETYERIWQGRALLDELFSIGLGPETVDALWERYQEAREDDEEMMQIKMQENQENPAKNTAAAGGGETTDSPKGAPKMTRVGAAALGIMSRLIQVIRMVYQCSDDGSRDFRLVAQCMHRSMHGSGAFQSNKKPMEISFEDDAMKIENLESCSIKNNSNSHPVSHGSMGSQRDISPHANGSQSKRNKAALSTVNATASEYAVVFSLWCLNPSVAFRQVANPAHSIILASGTLAPLDSFASELGVQFPIKLEAPHVINMKKQVWAGVISNSPSGMPLQVTYQHTNKPEFQDALGTTVVNLCQRIPDGVLLFLPSYTLLDKLSARWKVTGMWSRLSQLKHLVVEPRGGGPDALQSVINDYYNAIAEKKGGLFMAVCRGKVSEGLDFADANARGVIVAGIPFPNVKDSKVDSKRKFNDTSMQRLGLLSGDTWYEQQAFRALNQAIGRCIRHRGDWGAIFLVDERFKQPKYQRGLSRWVRGALAIYPSYQAATASLHEFYSRLHAEYTAIANDNANNTSIAEENDNQSQQPPSKDAFKLLMAGQHKIKQEKAKRQDEAAQQQLIQQQQQHDMTMLPSVIHPAQPMPSFTMQGEHSVASLHSPHALHAVIQENLTCIHHWADQELDSWTRYVVQQRHQGNDIIGNHYPRDWAVMGIKDTFEQAEVSLMNKAPCTWISTLHVELPRGIQAIAAAQAAVVAVRTTSASRNLIVNNRSVASDAFMKDVERDVLRKLLPGIMLDNEAVQLGFHKLRYWPAIQVYYAILAVYLTRMQPSVDGVCWHACFVRLQQQHSDPIVSAADKHIDQENVDVNIRRDGVSCQHDHNGGLTKAKQLALQMAIESESDDESDFT